MSALTSNQDLLASLRDYGTVAGKRMSVQDRACHAAADEIDRLTKREAELVAENNSMRWKLTDLGQRLATAEGRADELSRALKEQP